MTPGDQVLDVPWLDVGAGQSYMRDVLRSELGIVIDESAVNLDDAPYEYGNGYFKLITFLRGFGAPAQSTVWHLRELNRVLHPDGNLLLVTPNDHEPDLQGGAPAEQEVSPTFPPVQRAGHSRHHGTIWLQDQAPAEVFQESVGDAGSDQPKRFLCSRRQEIITGLDYQGREGHRDFDGGHRRSLYG